MSVDSGQNAQNRGPPGARGERSLIPPDVLKSYQEEMAEAEREESQRYLLEIASEPVELPSDPLTLAESAHCSYAWERLPSKPAPTDSALELLTRVELFEGLTSTTAAALMAPSRLVELGPGDLLFREGDTADSFFVVVEGDVEILRIRDEREVVLRSMHPFEVIGLFGLYSGRVRAACARALSTGRAVVLEIPSNALAEVGRRDEALRDRLMKLYQERLLEGFVGASRLFSDIDATGRARVLRRFFDRDVRPNETLLHPGEVANLLAVVIGGRLMLEFRPRAGEPPKLYEVRPGQFIAVTCAFTGTPSRARLFASEEARIAMLGHREMTELARDYPELRRLSSRLPSSARALDPNVFCGHTGIPGF